MTGKVRELFLTGVLIVLGILCFFCLVRSVRGPKLADRIMAVNMIGTMTMMSIAVLTVKLGEGFLADVALIYAMISFLAVVVLTKIYSGVYLEKLAKKKRQQQKAVQAESIREGSTGKNRIKEMKTEETRLKDAGTEEVTNKYTKRNEQERSDTL